MSDLPSGAVTLLFTDIEGSTRLLQQLGDLYPEILAHHRRLLRDAFAKWGGHEVDTQGDAFLFVFARAGQAVAAAVAAQRAIVGHSWPAGVVIRVRMGLHTGEPLRIAEGYVGLDVHRAARVGAVGYGGQVLCTEATADRVRQKLPPGVALRDLGRHRLKDLNNPEHIFQVAAADLPADFPPLRTLDRPPCHLPAHATSFVGQFAALARARDLLLQPGAALLTLTGPSGVGKTRLAVEAASGLCDDFADGVWFVPLPVGGTEVAATAVIAAALGVREVPGVPLVQRLSEHLRDRHLLLLLDGLEETDGVTPLLATLLINCPRLMTIATARTPLALRGERELPLQPLALPRPSDRHAGAGERSAAPGRAALLEYPAVSLFVERARAAKPDFVLSEESARLLVELADRLEGVPLAIELAAAQVKRLPLRALLTRLDRRLATLPPRPPHRPTRPQALREVIAWSYHLLTFPEQTLLRRLAVFAGGCTTAAAAAICSAIPLHPDGETGHPTAPPPAEAPAPHPDLEIDVAAGLTVLIEASLLRRLPSTGEPRFVLPEAVRTYAWERLTRGAEAGEIQQRHALYYLALAEAAVAAGADQGALDQVDADVENLRAAFTWSLSEPAEAELALRLATALEPIWRHRGLSGMARAMLADALARTDPSPPSPLRATALSALGTLAGEQGDAEVARRRLEESVALWRTLDERRGLAQALAALGRVAARQGDRSGACRAAEESLHTARLGSDTRAVADALALLGALAFAASDFGAARERFREMLVLERELEDTHGRALPLAYLGILSLLDGDQAGGRALVEESLALLRAVGDTARALTALGYLARLGWPEAESAAVIARAEEWLMLSRELRDEAEATRALLVLALAARRRGDGERAEACLDESLGICQRTGDLLSLAGCFAGKAAIMEAAGDADRAARLYAAAQVALERSPADFSPADRIDYNRIAIAVRAGQQAFGRGAAWGPGRAMSIRQAIALALD